jgi:hypothetical protein
MQSSKTGFRVWAIKVKATFASQRLAQPQSVALGTEIGACDWTLGRFKVPAQRGIGPAHAAIRQAPRTLDGQGIDPSSTLRCEFTL